MNKSLGIILIGFGIIGIYLGASGNLNNFWNCGIRGECGNGDAQSPGQTIAQSGVQIPGAAGHARGASGSNLQQGAGSMASVGQYYVSPTGALFVSDAGTY